MGGHKGNLRVLKITQCTPVLLQPTISRADSTLMEKQAMKMGTKICKENLLRFTFQCPMSSLEKDLCVAFAEAHFAAKHSNFFSQAVGSSLFSFAVQLWRLPFITNMLIKSIQARVQLSYQTDLQIQDSNPPNIIIPVKPSEINRTARHTQKSNMAKLFKCYQCQYRWSAYQRHYSKRENTKGLIQSLLKKKHR